MTVQSQLLRPKNKWLPLVITVLLTLLVYVVSITSLVSGVLTIFQNLFYLPIIIACVYYLKWGFVFSVILACSYFFLMLIFSRDPVVLQGALLRVLLFVVVAGVITYLSIARTRVESALEESEEFNRGLVDNMPNVVIVYDQGRKIRYTNPAATTILGYSTSEIIGSDIITYVVPDQRAQIAAAIQERFSSSQGESLEIDLVAKGGQHLTVISTGVPLQFRHQPAILLLLADISNRKRGEDALKQAHDELEQRVAERTKELQQANGKLREEITERTQAENELRVAQLQWSRVLDLSPDPIWIKDASGRYVAASKSYCKFHASATGNVIGKTDAECFPPDTAAIHVADDRIAIETGTSEGEFTALGDDGKLRTFLTKKVALRGPDGLLEGTLGVSRDITERKQAEEETQRQRAFFDQLVEIGPEAVSISDPQGKVTRVNAEFVRMFGYAAEETVGQNIDDLVAPAALQEEARAITGSASQGASASLETVRRRKDGTLIDVSLIVTPILVAGKLEAGYGIYRDITERKRAEEALTQNAMLLNEVQEVSHIGGWVYDVQTNHITWTREVYRIHELPPDYDPNDVANDIQFYSGDDRKLIEEAFGRAATAGAPYDLELQFITAKSNHRWVRTIGVPELKDGHVARVVGYIADITERKQAEAQLRQSYKMRAIGELAGGVAHDFNNLLTGILGSIALMRGGLPPADPLLENLNVAEAAAHQAAALTKGLLTFSRSAEVLPVSTNLTTALEAILALLKQSLPATMNIVRDYEQKAWNVLMDQSQITQILFNLALNARDAMKGNGVLTIRTRNEVLGDECARMHPVPRTGEFVHLSVTDTGPGMSADVMQHVFEPFYTTKPVGMGTGLGLSIVYSAVDQAGGWITVVSTEGVGTTFDIYLPRCLEESVPVPAPTSIPPGMDSGTILVVEDEPVVRAVAQALLSRSGYTVLTASDGASALYSLSEHPTNIDLILLDMTMPGMTTDEVVEAIRALNPTIPILLNSGHTSNDTINQMLEKNSVQGFLGKPYTLGDLVEKIHELLHKS